VDFKKFNRKKLTGKKALAITRKACYYTSCVAGFGTQLVRRVGNPTLFSENLSPTFLLLQK